MTGSFALVKHMEVLSSLPGRARWHLPILVDRPALAQALAAELQAEAGITSARADALTGNLLVTFDRAHTTDDVARRVPEALERALAAPRAPAGTAVALRIPDRRLSRASSGIPSPTGPSCRRCWSRRSSIACSTPHRPS